MTLDALQERMLRDFAADLRRDHLSATSVDHYVGAVRRGLAAGDLLDLIRDSRSRGSAFIARSAVTRWARWRKDKALERRVAAVPFLPHSPAKRTSIGPGVKEKILKAAARQAEPMRSLLVLVVLSGRRIGDLFAMNRKALDRIRLEAWRIPDDPIDPRVVIAVPILLRIKGWTTLGGLLSPAGWSASYAVLRRALRKACRDAGLDDYVPPEEFRRLAMAEAASKE